MKTNGMNRYYFSHEERGAIVSSLWLYTVQLPSRFLAVIEEVKTEEAYRRRGFATSLIKDAIKLARNLGCTCVELTVREDKPEIQEFYKSLGFEDRKNKSFRLQL